MKKEELLEIEDKSRIDKIIFNYPELMSADAEDTIKKMYSEMLFLEEELQKARSKALELEREINKVKERWNSIQSLFTYTHPTYSKKHIVETSTFTIRGHGNDIIGKTTVM